ncbi:MAG: adenylate/guanylate cyclase domain-containing protein [Oleispira sp.]
MGRSAVKISQRLTTSQQWAAFIAMAILMTGLTFSYLVTSQLRQQLLLQQQQLATSLVKDASILLRSSLSKDDRISANVILKDWVDQDLILSATLYNSTQQPIAEQGLVELGSYDVFWLNQIVTDEEQLIGHLRVAINMSQAHNISQRNAALLLLSTFMLSIISGLLAYFWGEHLLRANQHQIRALDKLHNNDSLDIISEGANSQNDQALNNAINSLIRQKQHKIAIKQSFDNFMASPNLSKSKSLTYHHSALLFIEIQGLKELQQRLSASQLSDTLSGYHQLLSHAAKLYNGTLDRYTGDGILIIFGYPDKDPRDASHCLYAAQLFLGLVQELQRNDRQLQQLSFKLSAHWGPVLIAPLEMNQQLQFSLIGDTVHWTAQLAMQSKEMQLLVSQDLVNQLSDAEQILWQPGPSLMDLNACEHDTRWLDALPDTAEKLIDRQVKHIMAMKEKA